MNGTPAREPIPHLRGPAIRRHHRGRVALLLSELQRTRAFDLKAAGDRPDHRYRLGGPDRRAPSNRCTTATPHWSGCSTLPTQLDLFPGRPAEIGGGGPGHGGRHPERWLQWPQDGRPKLALYGREPRVDGRAGAFGYPARHRGDGLLVGAVGGSAQRKPAVESADRSARSRHPGGSAAVRQRTYRAVRPGRRAGGNRRRRGTAVGGTRVLYLQHASDPVVWWSPNLFLRKPDWLKEPPGFDRTPSMRWYPIVTFFQVSADMAGNVTNAAGTPPGHGHQYGDQQLDGWVAVAAPEGWTPFDTDRVRRALEKAMASAGRSSRERQADPRTRFGRRPGGLELHRRDRPAVAAPPGGAGAVWNSTGRGCPGTVGNPAAGGWRACEWGGGGRCGRCGVALTTAVPRVRAAMDDRELPDRPVHWLGLEIPLGTVWSETAFRVRCRPSPPRPSAHRGRLLQAAAFGLTHVPDALETGSPWSAPCWRRVWRGGRLRCWANGPAVCWPPCWRTWPSMRPARWPPWRSSGSPGSPMASRRPPDPDAVRQPSRRSRSGYAMRAPRRRSGRFLGEAVRRPPGRWRRRTRDPALCGFRHSLRCTVFQGTATHPWHPAECGGDRPADLAAAGRGTPGCRHGDR